MTLLDVTAEMPAESTVPSPVPRIRRRPRRTRARSAVLKRLTKRDTLGVAHLFPVDGFAGQEPVTRADCLPGGCNEQRPCPWVRCKHHLYLDVNPATGSIKINFPDVEPEQLPESCALDVADRGGLTLDDVGGIMNLTRERIRQFEVRAGEKLKEAGAEALLALVADHVAQLHEDISTPMAVTPPITRDHIAPQPRETTMACSICGGNHRSSNRDIHPEGKPPKGSSKKKLKSEAPPRASMASAPATVPDGAPDWLAEMFDDFRTAVLERVTDELKDAKRNARAELVAKLEADSE